MNMCLKEKIGVDRIVITDIDILSIDYHKLESQENVVKKFLSNDILATSTNIDNLTYFKIKDNLYFKDFYSDRTISKNNSKRSATMILTVTNVLSDNLNNLSITEYKEHLQSVKQYLKSKYGISVSFRNASIKTIEINTTFTIENKYYQYERVLELICKNMPLIHSADKIYADSENNKTFYKENKYQSVKVYDKKAEMKKRKEDIENIKENNIIRFEYELKTKSKIKDTFNTAKLFEIDDEMIYMFFEQRFIKFIKTPIKKWRLKSNRKLRKMIKLHKSKNKITWQNSFLLECKNYPSTHNNEIVLLDINDLKPILAKYFNKNRHWKRTFNALVKKCKSIDRDIYLEQDSKKLDEILEKMEYIIKNQRNNDGY